MLIDEIANMNATALRYKPGAPEEVSSQADVAACLWKATEGKPGEGVVVPVQYHTCFPSGCWLGILLPGKQQVDMHRIPFVNHRLLSCTVPAMAGASSTPPEAGKVLEALEVTMACMREEAVANQKTAPRQRVAGVVSHTLISCLATIVRSDLFRYHTG
jgi:hypothetical protein